MCNLRGVKHPTNRLYYYPHDWPEHEVDVYNLPLRQNYAETMREVCAYNDDDSFRYWGISAYSCLPTLPQESVQFARAIPYTPMHLFINIIKELVSLWRGDFQCDQPPDDQPPEDAEGWEPPPYIIRQHWSEIGRELEKSIPELPGVFGAAPVNVQTHYSIFKRKVCLHRTSQVYLLCFIHG